MADLDSLSPPSRGAKEGYYPDPLGGKRARWWDGMRWTHQLGPLTEPTIAATGGKAGSRSKSQKPLPPPAKLCPHCGAQAETFGSDCPYCGKSYQRGNALKIAAIAGGVVLALLVGCGGCVALTLDDIGDERDAYAISPAEYRSVQPGTTLAATEARLGEPLDTEEFEQAFRNRTYEINCLYYDNEDFDIWEGGRRHFRLCFHRGRLYSKSAKSD